MREGDVVGGRWQLVAEAPGEGAVRRFRAVAVDTGEPAEILTLRGSAGADARRTFVATHRHLIAARDPALAATWSILEEQGEVAIVRPPLEDRTLADVPGPLPAHVVAGIGARLLPAVIAAGSATGGALLASDVGLDAEGRPVLAPRGRPLSRIDRAVTRAVAPEAFERATPDAAAGLYGLGALLYRLATGKEPPAGGPVERPPPPPPSALHHAVPPELDRAVLKLLSRDPSERASALPLLLELAGPVPDLRSFTARPVEVRTTVSGGETGARGAPVATAGAAVVLPAARLAELDPEGRNAVAGWAGLPVAVVDALASAGLPVVIEPSTSRSAARSRALEIARESGLPVVAITGRSLAPAALAVTTAIAVGLALVLGAVFLAVGLVPAAIVCFVVAGLSGIAGGWMWGRTSAWNALVADTRRAVRQADELTDSLDPDGVLRPSWQRLAQVRRALAGSALPAAAAADLRGALREIERRLQGMAEVTGTARRALASVDATRLRTRLAALDRGARTEEAIGDRDRLARALADLEEVEARRAALLAEARNIEGTLDEIGAVLARVSSAEDTAETELAELVRTTASARRVATPAAALRPRTREEP